MKEVKKRKIEASWGSLVITNELWTCPKCSVESNSVEWSWRGRPTESGYRETRTCPYCKYDFVEVV